MRQLIVTALPPTTSAPESTPFPLRRGPTSLRTRNARPATWSPISWRPAHFLSVLDGTPEPSRDPGDVVPAWAVARSDVEIALADPDRACASSNDVSGRCPFEVLVGLAAGS
jgi:hypothetical protein